MRKPWLVASFLLGLCSLALGQSALLTNLPPSTVVGRLGSSQSGAAQAIPFATLLAQLNGLNNPVAGPVSSTIGDMILWNNTGGSLLKDSGIAVTGSGTISLTAGKTITDTSAVGADLLLGATGGGFAAYGGTTCATGALTALSATGSGTCSSLKAATNSTVASPTGPNSTSVFKMQGLAGTITPAVTGKISITISGTIIESGITAAGSGIEYQISYGTGTAPTTNAALTGTQAGTVQEYMLANTVTAADVFVPFSVTVVVTGLTVGTAYWIDLAAEAVANTGFTFSNVNIAASEI